MSEYTTSMLQAAAKKYNKRINIITSGNSTFPNYVPNNSPYDPDDVAWYRYDKDGNIIFDNFDMSKYMNFVQQKYVSNQRRSMEWLVERDAVNHALAQGVIYGGKRRGRFRFDPPDLSDIRARYIKSIDDYRFDNVNLYKLFSNYLYKWVTSVYNHDEYQVMPHQLGDYLLDGFVLGRSYWKTPKYTPKHINRLSNELDNKITSYLNTDNNDRSNIINITINGSVSILGNDNSTINVTIENNNQ